MLRFHAPLEFLIVTKIPPAPGYGPEILCRKGKQWWLGFTLIGTILLNKDLV